MMTPRIISSVQQVDPPATAGRPLDRIVNALTVISPLELRYQILALNFPDEAIIKIALEMITNLRVVLSILDRYE